MTRVELELKERPPHFVQTRKRLVPRGDDRGDERAFQHRLFRSVEEKGVVHPTATSVALPSPVRPPRENGRGKPHTGVDVDTHGSVAQFGQGVSQRHLFVSVGQVVYPEIAGEVAPESVVSKVDRFPKELLQVRGLEFYPAQHSAERLTREHRLVSLGL